MNYNIGKQKFSVRELSYKDDIKLYKLIGKIDIPIPKETDLFFHAISVTTQFYSTIIQSKIALYLVDMILQIEGNLSVVNSFLWKFKSYRLNYYSRHIKGDLKTKIFTDFFTEGTAYESNLVNHLLKLLGIKTQQQKESNPKG